MMNTTRGAALLIIIRNPDGREHRTTTSPLRITYDRARDLFTALADGHEALARDPHADALHVRTLRYLIAADDTIVGFQIAEFSSFNPEEGNIDMLYTPRFSAPELGIEDAFAGQIVEVAQDRFL
jgi:hypothetical protein